MSSSSNNVENGLVVAGDASDMVGIDAESPPVNPLVQIHAILRGRYWLAITLAIIGLGIGIPAGYLIMPPTYKSTAVIQIKPYLPKVLYQTDQNTVMPMFDAFMESQVALMLDQKQVFRAMDDPDWVALKRTTQAERLKFSENLTVEHPKGSELIFVSFLDRNADAARTAVKAVTKVYLDSSSEDNASKTLDAWTRHQQELVVQQKAADDAIVAISKSVGASDAAGIKQTYELKLQQSMRLESQLQDINLAIALADEGPAATSKPAQTEEESLRILALRVPEIGRLYATHHDLERQILLDGIQLGKEHRTVKEEKAKLEVIDGQMMDLAHDYRGFAQDSSSASALAPGLKNLDQLKRNGSQVQKLYDAAKAEAELWGKNWANVEQFQGESASVKAKLDDATSHIEELKTELGFGGRTIAGQASNPQAPEKDKRVAFAAVGGLGLGGLGVGFVLLLGFFDRRVRHISDVPTSSRSARILGVLPLLPDRDADPEQAMIAAHSVHQIRMLLQHSQGVEKPVIAITSASPGAGKTSLTLALGLSFAASGARTLIIDCDIIGGGMTSKMKKVTRRRLGHILRRVGLINTQQLIAALKESKQTGELVGVTLVRRGLVTAADVDRALEVQRDAIVGLREALQGDPANECITGSGSPGLSLMPLGSAQRHHVVQLSYPALRRLINQVRAWYDVILIDTGPILGSLEASVAATASDAVVMTVARGDQRPLVERAMDQVAAAGGRIAGIVMNRAGATDIEVSGFSSSTRYLPGASHAPRPSRFGSTDHEGLRLGPIGSAVMALGEDCSSDVVTTTE